ncbi:hypothetical protein [Burkholderia sp. YIM B11467]
MNTKIERVEHANQLIQVIGAHGRRFFYNTQHDRYARIEVDARGKIWFVDDYTQKRVYTHNKGRWRVFSHGGTLRSLVGRMRDYITTGWQLPRGVIAPSYIGNRSDNIWGYSPEAAEAVRAAAFELPIVATAPWPSDMPRDYYVISVHHTHRWHKFITLWRPDDSGYCFRTPRAGRYESEKVRANLGYYNNGCANIAVPVDVIDSLTVMTTPADQLDGTDGPALLNTRAIWKKLIANVIARPEYQIEPEFPGARRKKEAA